MVYIAIINASTVLKDAEVIPVVNALQTQCDKDFTPIWHVGAKITFFPKGSVIPDNFWQLSILDNSDQADALGYHDITSTGRPLGKAFAATDMQYGLSWSVTTSHELLEMLADPWINLSVFDQRAATRGRIYAYEVCDACESDDYAYEIDGVKVSDFVTPKWFEGWRKPKSTKFDFKGHIPQPFALLDGGYISYFDATGGGWQQQTAAKFPAMKFRAPIGSRRERRKIDKEHWVESTV